VTFVKVSPCQFGSQMWIGIDITTPLQRKFHKLTDASRHNQLLHTLANSPQSPRPEPLAEPNSNLPLWRRVDRRFWWNEEVVSNFVEAGVSSIFTSLYAYYVFGWNGSLMQFSIVQLHDFVLPLMQGYVQTSTFHSPASTPNSPRDSASPEGQASDEKDENGYEDIQYTIISRRSRQRAGLRYQRRGVDEEANVANFVETETIIKMIVGSLSLHYIPTSPGVPSPDTF
jgi:phosphatidylinositol 4-phosphatase